MSRLAALGHTDELLTHIAQAQREMDRADDVPGRFGFDRAEFESPLGVHGVYACAAWAQVLFLMLCPWASMGRSTDTYARNEWVLHASRG